MSSFLGIVCGKCAVLGNVMKLDILCLSLPESIVLYAGDYHSY